MRFCCMMYDCTCWKLSWSTMTVDDCWFIIIIYFEQRMLSHMSSVGDIRSVNLPYALSTNSSTLYQMSPQQQKIREQISTMPGGNQQSSVKKVVNCLPNSVSYNHFELSEIGSKKLSLNNFKMNNSEQNFFQNHLKSSNIEQSSRSYTQCQPQNFLQLVRNFIFTSSKLRRYVSSDGADIEAQSAIRMYDIDRELLERELNSSHLKNLTSSQQPQPRQSRGSVDQNNKFTHLKEENELLKQQIEYLKQSFQTVSQLRNGKLGILISLPDKKAVREASSPTSMNPSELTKDNIALMKIIKKYEQKNKERKKCIASLYSRQFIDLLINRVDELENQIKESEESEGFIESVVKVLSQFSNTAKKWVQTSLQLDRPDSNNYQRRPNFNKIKEKLMNDLKAIVQSGKQLIPYQNAMKQIAITLNIEFEHDAKSFLSRVMQQIIQLMKTNHETQKEINDYKQALQEMETQYRNELSQLMKQLNQLQEEKQANDLQQLQKELIEFIGNLKKMIVQFGIAQLKQDEELSSQRLLELLYSYCDQQAQQEININEMQKENAKQLDVMIKRIDKMDKQAEVHNSLLLKKDSLIEDLKNRSEYRIKKIQEESANIKIEFTHETHNLKDQLSHNSHQYQLQIDQLTSKIDEKERLIKNLMKDYEVLELKIVEKEEAVSNLKQENEKWSDKLHNAQEKLAQSEGQVSELQSQVEEARVQLDNMNDQQPEDKKWLEDKIASLQFQNEELEHQIGEIKVYELQKKEAESKLKQVQIQLNHEITQKKSIQDKLEKQGQELVKQSQEHGQAIKEHEQQKQLFQSEKQKFISEKNELNNKLSKLKNDYSELQKEIKILDKKESKLKDFESEDGFYQTQLSSLQAEKKQLTEQLKQAVDELNDVKQFQLERKNLQKVENSEKDFMAVKELLERKNKDCQEKQDYILKMEAKNNVLGFPQKLETAMERAVENHNLQVSRLEQDLQKLSNTLNMERNSYFEQNNQHQQEKNELLELVTQLKEVKHPDPAIHQNQIASLEKVNQDFNSQLQEKNNQIHQLSDNIINLQQELKQSGDQKQVLLKEFNDKVALLETELKQQQDASAGISQLLNQIQSEQTESQNQINQLTLQNEARSKEFKQKDRHAQTLSNDLERSNSELQSQIKMSQLADKQLNLLKQQVDNLQHQLNEKEEELEAKVNLIKDQQKQLLDLQNTIKDQQFSSEKDIRKISEENAKEKKQLLAQIDSLQKQDLLKKNQNEELKTQLETAELQWKAKSTDLLLQLEASTKEGKAFKLQLLELKESFNSQKENDQALISQLQEEISNSNLKMNETLQRHLDELKRIQELSAQEVKMQSMELNHVKKDFSKQVEQLTQNYEVQLKQVRESERKLQLQLKDMNRQLQDKEDEVVEVEDELIKKDQQAKDLKEEYEQKLQSYSECIRKMQQNLDENNMTVNSIQRKHQEEVEYLKRLLESEQKTKQTPHKSSESDVIQQFEQQLTAKDKEIGKLKEFVENLREQKDKQLEEIQMKNQIVQFQNKEIIGSKQHLQIIDKEKQLESQQNEKNDLSGNQLKQVHENEQLVAQNQQANLDLIDKINLQNEQIRSFLQVEEKYSQEIIYYKCLVDITKEIIFNQEQGNIGFRILSLKDEHRNEFEQFRTDLVHCKQQYEEKAQNQQAMVIEPIKSANSKQMLNFDGDKEEINFGNGSFISENLSVILPNEHEKPQKEQQLEDEQPLLKKMEELIERLSLKDVEINKLNELARQLQQKHKIMELQKISVDPQAFHTKIHLKENFKRFLEACGQKSPDKNIADILLNNLFQFFEVTELEKDELLSKMTAKPADKKKGFISLMFNKK